MIKIKNIKAFFTQFSVSAFLWVLCFLGLSQVAFAKNEVSEIKERGRIVLVTNAEFEPFEYKEGSETVGIDIDIAKEIAKRMGVEIEIKDVSFDALPLELSRGSCDFALAGISYSEDKDRNVDFSNEAYFDAKQAIIVPKESRIKGREDLSGKKIGVHMGTTGDIYCTEHFKNSEISRLPNSTLAVLEMISGRIDAVVIDNLPAKNLEAKHAGLIKVLDDYLFEEQYRVVVPEGSELRDYIDKILVELKQDGTIEKIIESYTSSPYDFGHGFWGLVYNGLINKGRYKNILEGLCNTLKITCGALIIGVVIGSVIAFAKLSKSKKISMKILKKLADFYLTVIRGTPVVVQLFVIYYFIFVSTDLSKVAVAMIAFGINSGAYVGVVLQSGILSVDSGQYEAARSLGLSSKDAMIKVVFPQALKNVIANLCNEFIDLIKETSVAGFIGIMDLSRAGDIIRTQTLDPFVPLLSVALIYLLIVSILSWFMDLIERRLRKSDIR